MFLFCHNEQNSQKYTEMLQIPVVLSHVQVPHWGF